MKKVVTAILAVFYLGTSSGATIHFHYCMDKLVAWGFDKDKTSPKSCPYCGMEKTASDKHCIKETKGCCKDEQKQVKVEKDQKAPEVGFNLAKPILYIADYSSINISSIVFSSPTLEYPTSHAPPGAENIPLFLRNGVFRI